jgi:hypothetical protein
MLRFCVSSVRLFGRQLRYSSISHLSRPSSLFQLSHLRSIGVSDLYVRRDVWKERREISFLSVPTINREFSTEQSSTQVFVIFILYFLLLEII